MNPLNEKNLPFDLPGGGKAEILLDFTYWQTIPSNIQEKDIAAFLQAPLPIACSRLGGTIRFTEESFSGHCYCELYEFKWATDFRNEVLLIYLLNVEKSQQGKGIGFHLFAHQLDWCRRFSIKHIRLFAEGGWLVGTDQRWELLPLKGLRQIPEQNGYYTWGRFGFEMYPQYKGRFQSWNNYFKCQGARFPQLLFNESDRRKWKDLGFSWRGKFNVDPASSNTKSWERYVSSREPA